MLPAEAGRLQTDAEGDRHPDDKQPERTAYRPRQFAAAVKRKLPSPPGLLLLMATIASAAVRAV